MCISFIYCSLNFEVKRLSVLMDIMPQMPSMDLYRTGTLFNAHINASSVPLRRAPSSCFERKHNLPPCSAVAFIWLDWDVLPSEQESCEERGGSEKIPDADTLEQL